MKFNSKLFSVLFVFMILNSNILALKEKSGYSRRSRNKNKSVHHFSNENTTRGCDGEDKNINVWIFLFNLTRTAFKSAIKHITKDMMRPLKSAAHDATLNCKQIVSEEFKRKMDEAKEEMIQERQRSTDLMGDMGEAFNNLLILSPEQRQSLERKKDNPKQLCKENVKILKSIQTSSEESNKILSKMIEMLNYTQQEGLKHHFTNLKDFKDYLDCYLCWGDGKKAKTQLLFFLESNVKIPDLAGEDFKLKMAEFIPIFEEERRTHQNHTETVESLDEVSCSSLPEHLNEQDKCQKISVAAQVKALFSILWDKKAEIVGCLIIRELLNIPKNIIQFILTSIAKILSMLAAYFLKAFVMVYYVYKIIKNLIEASKATTVNKKSKFWGIAGGFMIKLLLIFSPVPTGMEKRRMMKLKLR